MFEKTVTVAFFAATFSAVALAAVLGAKGMHAGEQAFVQANAPVVKLETVVIAGQRTKVSALTPEQVAIAR